MTAPEPCDVCRICHRGRRCFARTRRLTFNLPESLATRLKKQVPEGERSRLIARLLDDHFHNNPNDHEGTL